MGFIRIWYRGLLVNVFGGNVLINGYNNVIVLFYNRNYVMISVFGGGLLRRGIKKGL